MLSEPYIDCSPIPPQGFRCLQDRNSDQKLGGSLQLEKNITYCTVDLLVNVRVEPLIVAPLVGLGQFEQVA